jgi:hypothetical protein
LGVVAGKFQGRKCIFHFEKGKKSPAASKKNKKAVAEIVYATVALSPCTFVFKKATFRLSLFV